MKHIHLYLLLFVFQISDAQDIILPGLNGEELLSELAREYKPATVLNYSNAREYMYENLQLQKDTIEGIYTGFKIYLPENAPSRSWTFENGINTEHIYPRSKGASDGNAFSDLHHLKPSKSNVNSSRLNHPFKEIDDDVTKKWFRKEGATFDIPTEHINEYSELDSFVTSSGFIIGDFEPRESVKGDIARAVFYFFTMYEEEAIAADPNYFESMREDLCRWHVQDPPNLDEMRFSELIAEVQDGKTNPFVMDCSITLRSYCANLNLQCEERTVPTVELSENGPILIVPNPSTGRISITSPIEIKNIDIYDYNGATVYSIDDVQDHTLHIDLNLPLGLYNLMVRDKNGKFYLSRLIIQK